MDQCGPFKDGIQRRIERTAHIGVGSERGERRTGGGACPCSPCAVPDELAMGTID
uniref:Uncharacterized protein n=1 Tax=Oryza sativa subsp. japonica TaxID=39947 RepID=Q6K3Q2_ORYSJ|nr:hypothetical protein [Oryza sativa Japonica Group]